MPPIFVKFGSPFFSLPGSWKMPSLLREPPANLRVVAESTAFAEVRPGQTAKWPVHRLWAMPKNGKTGATPAAFAPAIDPEEQSVDLLARWEKEILSRFPEDLRTQFEPILGMEMENFLAEIQQRLRDGESVEVIRGWHESEVEARYGETFRSCLQGWKSAPKADEIEMDAAEDYSETIAQWTRYTDNLLEKILVNFHDIERVQYLFERTTFSYLGTNDWTGFETKAPVFVRAMIEKLQGMFFKEGMGLTADLLRQRIFVDKTLRPICRVEFSIGKYLNDLLDDGAKADWQEAFAHHTKIVLENLPRFWRDPLFASQPAEVHTALKTELMEYLMEGDFDNRDRAELLWEIVHIFCDEESPIRLGQEKFDHFRPRLRLLSSRINAGRLKDDPWDPTWREPASAPPTDAWGFAELTIDGEIFTLFMGKKKDLGGRPSNPRRKDLDSEKHHLTAILLSSNEELLKGIGLSQAMQERLAKRVLDPRTNPKNVASVLWDFLKKVTADPEEGEEWKRTLRQIQEFNLTFLPEVPPLSLSEFILSIEEDPNRSDLAYLGYWTDQIVSEGVIRRIRVGDQYMRISKELYEGSADWQNNFILIDSETGSLLFKRDSRHQIETITLGNDERVYYESLQRLKIATRGPTLGLIFRLDILRSTIDPEKGWLEDYLDILTDFHSGEMPREEALARICRFALQHRDKIWAPPPFDEKYHFRGKASLDEAKVLLKKIAAEIPPLFLQAFDCGEISDAHHYTFRKMFSILDDLLFRDKSDSQETDLMERSRPSSPYDDRWTLEETERALILIQNKMDILSQAFHPVRMLASIADRKIESFPMSAGIKALLLTPTGKKRWITDFEAHVRSRIVLKREFTFADLEKPAVNKAFEEASWIEVVTRGLEEYGKMVRGEPHDTNLMKAFMHLLQNARHAGEFMWNGEKVVAERTARLRRGGAEFIAGISGKKHFLGRFRQKYLKDPAFRMTYDVISRFNTDLQARRQVAIFYVLGALISVLKNSDLVPDLENLRAR